MGSANSSLPYAQEEEVPLQSVFNVAPILVASNTQNHYKLYNGSRKEDGAPVSIFHFNKATAPGNYLAQVRNHVKKLKTLRFPDILKFIDEVEIADAIFIVTERVTPLLCYDTHKENPLSLSLGIKQVTSALAFLNGECGIQHGQLTRDCVYVSRAGDWKLSGFHLSRTKEELKGMHNSDIARMCDSLPSALVPPELTRSGRYAGPLSSLDSWLLACFIHQVFAGQSPEARDLANLKVIPTQLHKEYKRLLRTDPKQRMNAAGLLKSGFFNNDYVKMIEFVDNLALKSAHQKEVFFQHLESMLSGLPKDICQHRILPQLLTAIEFGASASSQVLSLVLVISASLAPQQYKETTLPLILKLFKSNSRAIRACLLKNLCDYINYIDEKDIAACVFPSVKTGFKDTEPVIREWTVKSLVYIIPKLSERALQTQVLPYIPKLQEDEKPSIRTNTVVVIGKVAQSLTPTLVKKAVIPTFVRALRDPFIPSRISALNAFKALHQFEKFTNEMIIAKVIPALSFHLIDPAPQVRELAFPVLQLYIQRLKVYADSIPAPEAPEPGSGEASGDRGQALSSLGGWAKNKLYGESSPPAEPERIDTLEATVSVAGVSENNDKNVSDVFDSFEENESSAAESDLNDLFTEKLTVSKPKRHQKREKPLKKHAAASFNIDSFLDEYDGAAADTKDLGSVDDLMSDFTSVLSTKKTVKKKTTQTTEPKYVKHPKEADLFDDLIANPTKPTKPVRNSRKAATKETLNAKKTSSKRVVRRPKAETERKVPTNDWDDFF